MTQKTNLNISPYFDDFDANKNFYNEISLSKNAHNPIICAPNLKILTIKLLV